MVASAFGGIVDQLPTRRADCFSAISRTSTLSAPSLAPSESPEDAKRFGANALDRVSELCRPDHRLMQYASLLEHLVDGG